MTSTVEISVQKAIDPYLKIENLGRRGENAMTPTLTALSLLSAIPFQYLPFNCVWGFVRLFVVFVFACVISLIALLLINFKALSFDLTTCFSSILVTAPCWQTRLGSIEVLVAESEDSITLRFGIIKKTYFV
jgi:hypothetical protein